MRFFSKNIYRSVVTHWKANLLILADLILCSLMLFIMLQNYFFAAYEYNHYFGNENLAERYRMNVVYDDSTDNPYQASSPMYEVALQVKDEIWSSPLWKAFYIVLFTMPTEWLDPSLPNTFDVQNDPTIPRAPEETGINSYIFSEDVIRLQNIRLQEGRAFNSEDYQVDSSTMPIIMGYDFTPYYDVGDMITQGDLSFAVIGFFEKSAFCSPSEDEIHNLDKSVVLPKVLYPESFPDEPQLAFSLGADLAPANPQTDVQNELNRITSKYGFYSITCEPTDGSAYTRTETTTEKNITLILFLTIVSAILCLTALSNILFKRTIKDQATYCTYLLSGIPLWKINLSVIIELAFLTGISVFPSIALSYLEYGQLFVSPWHILGFMALIVTISMIPCFLITGKTNLDLFIRSRSE